MKLSTYAHFAANSLNYYFNKRAIKPYGTALILTDKCNSRCIMCDYWKRPARKELSTQEWKRIIQSLHDFGIKYFSFVGGEAMLRPDLLELAGFAKSLPKTEQVKLTTNGLLMNEKNAEDFVETFDVIEFSIDGADRETYKKIRGVNGFENAVKNIRRINSLASGKACINFVIQRDNWLQVEKMIDLAESLSAPINFSMVSLTPISNAGADPSLREVDMNELKEILKKNLKRKIVRRSRDFWEVWFGEKKFKRCFLPFQGLAIGSGGELYACCTYSMIIGNVLEKPIEQIYDETFKFRENAVNLRFKECKNCFRPTDSLRFNPLYLAGRFFEAKKIR